MRKLSLGKILTHMLLLFIVIVWILPTFGLLISSLRDKDQVALTGWWTALKYNEFNEIVRTAKSDKQVKSGKLFIIEGNLLGEGSRKKILKEEIPVTKFAFASVVTIKQIKKGEKFTKKNIWVKRPGTGQIHAREYYKILNKKAKRDLDINKQIKYSDIN